jgi:hypothetical protein
MNGYGVRVAAAAVLVVAALAGCGGGDADPVAAPEVTVENTVPVGDGPIDGADGLALEGTEYAPPSDDTEPDETTPKPRIVDATGDAEVTSCTVDTGLGVAKVLVTNSADLARHYQVKVYFYDASKVRVEEDEVLFSNVKPGGQAAEEGVWIMPDSAVAAGEEPTCEIASVRAVPASVAESADDMFWFNS